MAFNDKVGTAETVSATLETEVAAPHHPCPFCGKETNDRSTAEVDPATRHRTVTEVRRVCTGCGKFHNPDE
jgi:predicted RNA-binding Zn-ribbon protein involved in translation (DUF1610 family)